MSDKGKRRKCIVTILYVICMVLVVSGCGKDKSVEEKDANKNYEYGFSDKGFVLDNNIQYAELNCCQYKDGALYFVCSGYIGNSENTNMDEINRLMRFEPETGKTDMLFEFDCEEENIVNHVEDISVVNDDRVAVLESETVNDDIDGITDYILKKNIYSFSGEKKETMELEAVSSANSDWIKKYQMADAKLAASGKVYVLFGRNDNYSGEMYVFDENGKIESRTQIMYYANVIEEDSKGNIFICGEDKENPIVRYYDENSKKLSEPVKEINNISEDDSSVYTTYYKGSENEEILINDGVNLSYYCSEDKRTETICSFNKLNFIGQDIFYVAKCQPEKYICVIYDEMDETTNKYSIGYIEKKEIKADLPVITVVVPKSEYDVAGLSTCILKRYKNNPDYRVEMITYEEFEKGVMEGNTPDIFIGGYYAGAAGIAKYNDKEYFEDLTGYIENDDTLNETVFLDGVLDAITVDGKLPFLMNGFMLQTMTGRKTVIGEYEGKWTIDNFIKCCKEQDSNVDILGDTSSRNMAGILLRDGMEENINWKTGECTFDSGEFGKMLEFCGRYGDGEESYDFDSNTAGKEICNGTRMCMVDVINSVAYMAVNRIALNEDVAYMGFPSKQGGSIEVLPINTMSIFKASEHKEEAWEIIKEVILDTKTEGAIPVLNNEFDEHVEEVKKMVAAGCAVNDVRIDTITEEDINMMKELVKRAVYAGEFSYEIYSVIIDDIYKYFDGEKKLEDTIKIIQDRMEKYVNENR